MGLAHVRYGVSAADDFYRGYEFCGVESVTVLNDLPGIWGKG